MLLPVINFTTTTMIAITSKMWMRLPAAYPKYPIAHISNRTAAIKYNIFPITIILQLMKE
jgi:hypothetical protein